MWRAFRVELASAKALPWDLLRPATVFSNDDPLIRKAASNHLRHVAEHISFLSEVDFSGTLAEWEHWRDLFIRRFQPGVRHKIDLDRFKLVIRQLERYEYTYDLLNDSFFSLVAIGLFSAGLLREQILDILDGKSWATKHEVLTRWGWMEKHRELLQKGHPPLAPYSCVVTYKDQYGRQADEEFYHLLAFLHLLRANHGEELLFAKKGETPDFTLGDEEGKPVGAEMRDVWISDEWAKEQDAADKSIKYILNQFQGHLVDVHVQTPKSWRVLSSRLPEVGKWISSQLLSTLRTETLLRNTDLDLAIELTPADKPTSSISWGSALPRGSFDIDKHSRDLHASLREGIERKLVKKGKPRNKPSVRPCHLVIYPHHRLDANLESVIHEFFQSPPIDVSSHFEKVWLCDGQRLVPLTV